jgi:hypothetical protein
LSVSEQNREGCYQSNQGCDPISECEPSEHLLQFVRRDTVSELFCSRTINYRKLSWCLLQVKAQA